MSLLISSPPAAGASDVPAATSSITGAPAGIGQPFDLLLGRLAEVVRNLAVRNNEKGLSTGEKQMFVKAKKILASELMYAKDMSEDEAAAWLDDVLSRAGQPKAKARAKPKPAPASA